VVVGQSTKDPKFEGSNPGACTINVYDRRFYNRKLRSSLERKLRSYNRNPT
jgi:hypothetical protein